MELRIFTEPQQGAAYHSSCGRASGEDLGFGAFFRSDHYLGMGTDGLPGPTDAWITLAALASETSRIRLGTLVSPVTFRLPGPLAISVAQVDAMSGGRVELGIGAGWFEANTPRTGSRSRPCATGSTCWRSSWRSSPDSGRRRRAVGSPTRAATTP